MDYIKWLPILFRLLALVPRIKEAIANNTGVVSIFKQFGPDFMTFMEQIGGMLSPGASTEAKIELGALKTFDHERVMEIQRALNEQLPEGFEPIAVDGDYGEKTTALVKAIQTDLGFTGEDVDGWAGHKTMEALAERRGASGKTSVRKPKK